MLINKQQFSQLLAARLTSKHKGEGHGDIRLQHEVSEPAKPEI